MAEYPGVTAAAAAANVRFHRVSRSFVTKSDAVPSVDNPGPVVGISSAIMGDMMDALWAAFRGDHKKVAADVVDMARCQNIREYQAGSVARMFLGYLPYS